MTPTRQPFLTALLDLVCCGLGAAAVLWILSASWLPQDVPPVGSTSLVVRCRKGPQSPPAEIGIEFRPPSQNHWVSVDPSCVRFSAESNSSSGGQAFLVFQNPEPGYWQFRSYLRFPGRSDRSPREHAGYGNIALLGSPSRGFPNGRVRPNDIPGRTWPDNGSLDRPAQLQQVAEEIEARCDRQGTGGAIVLAEMRSQESASPRPPRAKKKARCPGSRRGKGSSAASGDSPDIFSTRTLPIIPSLVSSYLRNPDGVVAARAQSSCPAIANSARKRASPSPKERGQVWNYSEHNMRPGRRDQSMRKILIVRGLIVSAKRSMLSWPSERTFWCDLGDVCGNCARAGLFPGGFRRRVRVGPHLHRRGRTRGEKLGTSEHRKDCRHSRHLGFRVDGRCLIAGQ